MFTKNQHVRINDPQSRYNGQPCTIVNGNGVCYYVRLDDGLCLCVIPEQLKFIKK